MIDATVHRGIDALQRQMFPLEFVYTSWVEHRAVDHDGATIVAMLKEYGVYRRVDFPDEHWALPTGLYKLVGAGPARAGNLAFCLKEIAAYRAANPRGLSPDVLAMIEEFLKTSEAEDGRKSIPPPDQADQGR